jgi:hypothetical protein
MADNSLLPLSGDEKLALVAGLKRLIDEDPLPAVTAGADAYRDSVAAARGLNQMPTLHIDDAREHLVEYLRDVIAPPPPRTTIIAGGTKYGHDLWLPSVVLSFWQSRGHPNVTADPHVAAYYHPFYDAAWELCRIGVLRPGQSAPMGDMSMGRGSEYRGDGFSLTEFGRGWVQTAAQHPPGDPSRFSEVVQPFIGHFGEGFAQRAVEASHCYQTTNYLACCVMAGAAAESILLAVATAKMAGNEGKALNEYRVAHGRKKITDQITGGLQQGLRERFVTASSILNFWRDEAAHGTRTTITAVEAQFSLAQLLQFAQLTTDNWDTLTQGPPAPAPI